MNTKTLLCIGAGPFQLKGIQTAKKMGLAVVATDGSAEAPGLRYADRAFVVDVKDIEQNLEIARSCSIDGVVTVASDVTVKTVAAIAEALQLPGIPVSVAERCTDKALMRQAFVAHGVPSPTSYPVLDFSTLLAVVDKIGLPVVVKPADSAGSRGVRKVTHEMELKEAYECAIGYSQKKKVVVEDFMEGIEVSVEAFVDRGTIRIIGLSDKKRTPPPYLLDIQVTFPSRYPSLVQQRIIAVAKHAITAVGITTGPVHMELMMTKDGPVPVELAARGPGFKVFTDILPMISGIDLIQATIKASLGLPPDLIPTKQLASSIKFFASPSSGRIHAITGVETARAMEGIYEMEIYVKPGDPVRTLTSGADRIGHIISMAENAEEAEARLAQAEQAVVIELG
ncbi:ATP-grasp domain-containing protein [Candidatus Uhrbacteria bacterium]|nr:ATP-grasp domain-containing protein [Candidatus Uhrbacteria bacterium]